MLLDGYGQMPNRLVAPYANKAERLTGDKPQVDRMHKTMQFFRKATAKKSPMSADEPQLLSTKWNKEYAKSVAPRSRNATVNSTAQEMAQSKTQQNLFHNSPGTSYLTAPMWHDNAEVAKGKAEIRDYLTMQNKHYMDMHEVTSKV